MSPLSWKPLTLFLSGHYHHKELTPTMCFSDTVSMVVLIWTECCHLDKNMFMVLAFG